MTIKSQIKNILLKNLQYIDCDNCKYQDTDNCYECHRKYISWSLSPEVAEDIAEEILSITIYEKYKYKYCDNFCVKYGKPRCLATKEMGYCNCEGNKNECNFYNLTSK